MREINQNGRYLRHSLKSITSFEKPSHFCSSKYYSKTTQLFALYVRSSSTSSSSRTRPLEQPRVYQASHCFSRKKKHQKNTAGLVSVSDERKPFHIDVNIDID
jgi:hypothetical protein